jgi:translation initiation factor IF-3
MASPVLYKLLHSARMPAGRLSTCAPQAAFAIGLQLPPVPPSPACTPSAQLYRFINSRAAAAPAAVDSDERRGEGRAPAGPRDTSIIDRMIAAAGQELQASAKEKAFVRPAAKPAGRTFRPRTAPGAKKPDITRPLANEEIRYASIRVVDSDGKNLGVMAPAEALGMARSRGLDLVLTTSAASPPVCKLTVLSQVVNVLKKEAAESKKNLRDNVPKEMRFTARISDHDIDVKVAKILEFLKDGRPVKVTVSFTLSAWLQQEPNRREVLAKVVRKVGEAGVGFCDPSSIKGEGANLQAMFNPTSTPKTAADIERTLAKLVSPMAVGSSDVRVTHIQATAMAAMDGTASKATVAAVLPPANILARFRKPKIHAAEPEEGDEAGRTARAEALIDGEPVDLGMAKGAIRHKSKKDVPQGKKKPIVAPVAPIRT